jgi:dTDP-4-amino-4,6-dideoxygalactose transaminase
MYVSPWPGIMPRDLFATGPHRDLPYPLGTAHQLCFCVARSGIYHLFRALRLKPTDVVLAPDYHSGNEVSAMVAAGATIVYYPIRRNLEPDMDVLSSLARRLNPRVIYAIHYLGWPQPLAEIESLCRERDCILVEDCALALLSEAGQKPLGTTGDYSVFCLYKTLPVPNGGLLIQNRNLLNGLASLELEQCPRIASAGRTAELVLEAVRSRRDRVGKLLFNAKQAVGRALRRRGVRHVPVGDIGWNLSNVRIGMSRITQKVTRVLDYRRIRETRRENFLRLRQMLGDSVSMLREDLPEGVCPLFFPILVEDKLAAARALRNAGVSAVEFWNEEHPHAAAHSGANARFLRSHVLELPIHQDVTPAQLSYIADQVQRLRLRPLPC